MLISHLVSLFIMHNFILFLIVQLTMVDIIIIIIIIVIIIIILLSKFHTIYKRHNAFKVNCNIKSQCRAFMKPLLSPGGMSCYFEGQLD